MINDVHSASENRHPPSEPRQSRDGHADPDERAHAPTGSGHHAAFLTAAQLAACWQVPIRTIYAWARRNAVPHYRAGRLLRFDPRAVEEHFRRHGFAEELVADPERPGESAFSLLNA